MKTFGIKKITAHTPNGSISFNENSIEMIMGEYLHRFISRRKGIYRFRNIHGGYSVQMDLSDKIPDSFKKFKKGDEILMDITNKS